MTKSSYEVITAWGRGEDAYGENVESDNGFLRHNRYGPLGAHLKGEWDLLEGAQLRGGGWGHTASGYQGVARRAAREKRILVPGTLLAAALEGSLGNRGLPKYGLDRIRPIQAMEDIYTPITRAYDGDHKRYDPTTGAWTECGEAGRHEHTEQVHHLGGCIFRVDPYHGKHGTEGRRACYFLTGQDDGSFFLSQLPRRPRDYQDGLLALMPAEVAERTGRVVTQVSTSTTIEQTGRFEAFGQVSWEVRTGRKSGVSTRTITRVHREYPGGVLRQGEWFFIPEDPPAAARGAKNRSLNGADSAHVATRAAEHRGRVWVSGVVRHVRHDHPALYLKGLWYRVVRNRAVRSWSLRRNEGGRVD